MCIQLTELHFNTLLKKKVAKLFFSKQNAKR